jgi:hypothetical protein
MSNTAVALRANHSHAAPARIDRTLHLYQPHALQKALHEATSRYIVAAWGRQSGKSTWAVNHLVFQAWVRPKTRYWFVSPTYSQALQQYRRAVGMLFNCNGVLVKKNQTELRIKLMNQSEIRWVSGQTYQRLRGETLHGAVLDEVRDLPDELWAMVIKPMLATTRGWAAFISTPNGFDRFFEFYERAKASKTQKWISFNAPSTCSPYFSQEEFDEAREEMSEPIFAQEILAEFRDLTAGKAYIGFNEKNRVDFNPFRIDLSADPHAALPIVLAMDFNLSPMCWTLGQTKVGEFYWFDEIYLENSHTQEASKVLVEKLEALRAKKYNVDVIIVGDATGKAGQRAAAGKSDYDIVKTALREAGFRFDDRTPDSNPPVKDRVNNVNRLLKAFDGSARMFINPEGCPQLIKDLQRVVWKSSSYALLDQTGKNKTRTHASDGIGYAAWVLCPVTMPGNVGRVRVIHRG